MLSFFQETKKHDPQSIGGQKGFTVIEMIVAASLLVTTMTLVVAIFLNSITGQRKIISFEQASSNARFLMDIVSREIRVSTICGDTAGVRPCAHANNNTPSIQPGITLADIRLDIIKNEAAGNTPITYCLWRSSPLDDQQLELRRLVNDSDFTLNPCQDIPPAGTQVLNSPEVALLGFTGGFMTSGFVTQGVGQSPPGSGACRPATASPQLDICQPRTTIILWVQSVTQKNAVERSDVRIQTTLSQRLIDVQ